MSALLNYSYSGESLQRVLEDLFVRFVINCPAEDLSSVERLFFQIEEARWFYMDYVRQQEPSLPIMNMKFFSHKLIESFPYIWKWGVRDSSNAVRQFGIYKSGIPVRGAVLLNKQMSKVLLVQGMDSNSSWGFPRGKINKSESDEECAIREVYEEIGFDIKLLLNPNDYISKKINGKNHKIFIIYGIPLETSFVPQTRNEIGNIEWHLIKSLCTKEKSRNSIYFFVTPFLQSIINKIKNKRNTESKVANQLLRVQEELKMVLGVGKYADRESPQPLDDSGGDLGIINSLHATVQTKSNCDEQSLYRTRIENDITQDTLDQSRDVIVETENESKNMVNHSTGNADDHDIPMIQNTISIQSHPVNNIFSNPSLRLQMAMSSMYSEPIPSSNQVISRHNNLISRSNTSFNRHSYSYYMQLQPQILSASLHNTSSIRSQFPTSISATGSFYLSAEALSPPSVISTSTNNEEPPIIKFVTLPAQNQDNNSSKDKLISGEQVKKSHTHSKSGELLHLLTQQLQVNRSPLKTPEMNRSKQINKFKDTSNSSKELLSLLETPQKTNSNSDKIINSNNGSKLTPKPQEQFLSQASPSVEKPFYLLKQPFHGKLSLPEISKAAAAEVEFKTTCQIPSTFSKSQRGYQSKSLSASVKLLNRLRKVDVH